MNAKSKVKIAEKREEGKDMK